MNVEIGVDAIIIFVIGALVLAWWVDRDPGPYGPHGHRDDE